MSNSSNKLFTGDPNKVTVIRQLTPEIITFSVPFSRFGVLKFGGRGTLIKLPSNNLLVFSPVTLTSQIRTVISNLGGKVRYLVAPDIEHHIHLSAWKTAYPEAQILAPEGLYERRVKQGLHPKQDQHATNDHPPTDAANHPPPASSDGVDFTFDYIFTPTNQHTLTTLPAEFRATFEIEYIHSHANREIVLFHKPSRYLIQADLLFNLPAWEQYSLAEEDADAGAGWWNRMFMGWMKTATEAERKAQARFIWWVLAAGDRKAFGESVRRIAAWGVGAGGMGIVPCHGDVIEDPGTGKEVFEGVFRDFLKE
ncbi:uncharacterized protein BP01DRAFT_417258 [Aspergillus saccharolyticus JOP 1030-1]|uniref:Uncharacterized protein n=1 Tax=Aspergillus saccharolyticus JOP 1030-1 TaxID=1450539 RepID=A0A318Z895_9EURO|nr:hypothetical protein BP01DRAFT_417258 [Aspergillus saccharolyticus JOP 1030-1]PYH43541.1 hypothetical protein BP01DRAFT_417258 [Aspergillus saccharolyticus JOP 1030-1]